MAATPEWKNPISWTSPPSPSTSFADHLLSYHLVFLPGGHDKGVRQVIDSPVVASALSSYFPLTNKEKVRQTGEMRSVGAICHGVLGLSEAKLADGSGKSVLHDVQTTGLPHAFEQGIYYTTMPFLGDYYKTYGAGSKSVEEAVKERLSDPKLWKGSVGPKP
jgi:putative intracellular protease/amidase